ncbi:MAG: YbhB/YbcL family Raf kinase inhibitor-like protein, partial [Candidatus Melainabacteria bacterium]|nr:YbhB/YbcL family Raf kinase inhibitor-like protein [Candidatus Melainabacteria bacterium]
MTKIKVVVVILLAICQVAFSQPSFAKKKIILTSTAFEDKTILQEKYTCDGENISPPLKWNDLPEKTKSIAIIMEDLDSPKIK